MKRQGLALPLEIVRKIAMILASLGSRSAVTAALLHPSFTREALNRLHGSGITAMIEKPSSLDMLVSQLAARATPVKIGTLRLRPHLCCSLTQGETVRRVLDHLLEVEYDIEDLQLALPLQKLLCSEKHANDLPRMNSVRRLTILHGPYPIDATGMALNVEEITLVEPGFVSMCALHTLSNLSAVYLFFVEDDEFENGADTWTSSLRRYALGSRRGILNLIPVLKWLTVPHIYFIIIDGDPRRDSVLLWTGRMMSEGGMHDFYRFCHSSDLNEFQRLQKAKDMIDEFERNRGPTRL